MEDVDYLTRTEQLRLLPGAAEALRLLHAAGYLLIVVTNQSAIARGWLTEEGLQNIHARLEELLGEQGAVVDAWYYCPHLPNGQVQQYAGECSCRKPEPGLLQRAAREWDVALGRSWAVGDSERDVEAGRRAGCRTVLLGGEAVPTADALAPDLLGAARLILDREDNGREKAPQAANRVP